MAKDVTLFLCWTAEPEHDERKKAGIKIMAGLTLAAIAAGWYKRFLWSLLPGPLCGAICPGALETKAIMATAISVAQTHYYFTSRWVRLVVVVGRSAGVQ